MDIVAGARTAASLKAFIEGPSVIDAISAIGTNETKTAVGALKKAEYSSNRREAINCALTHLESAYEQLIVSSRIIRFLTSPTKLNVRSY